MDIVITAPHAACANTATRSCDKRAAYAATRLETYLAKHLRMANVTLLVPDTVRAAGDLNRVAARNTDWRRRVQFVVGAARAARRRVLLLDVHSFPDTGDSFGTYGGAVPAVVLLEVPGAHTFAPPADVVVLQASMINDIVVSALSAGADAFLWEFNENPRRSTDAVIDSIGEAMRAHVLGPRFAPISLGACARPTHERSAALVVAPVAGDVCNIDLHCWPDTRGTSSATIRVRASDQWPSVRSNGCREAPLFSPLRGQLTGFIVDYADSIDEPRRSRAVGYTLEFRNDVQTVVLRLRLVESRPIAGQFVFAPHAIDRGARALTFAAAQHFGSVAPGCRVDVCVSPRAGRAVRESAVVLGRAVKAGTPLYRTVSAE